MWLQPKASGKLERESGSTWRNDLLSGSMVLSQHQRSARLPGEEQTAFWTRKHQAGQGTWREGSLTLRETLPGAGSFQAAQACSPLDSRSLLIWVESLLWTNLIYLFKLNSMALQWNIVLPLRCDFPGLRPSHDRTWETESGGVWAAGGSRDPSGESPHVPASGPSTLTAMQTAGCAGAELSLTAFVGLVSNVDHPNIMWSSYYAPVLYWTFYMSSRLI